LGEYIRALSPPFQTPLRFILNRLIIIWVHLVGFWPCRPHCQIFLFLEHFKLCCCCFWSSLEGLGVPSSLANFFLCPYWSIWSLVIVFGWNLAFCWSSLCFEPSMTGDAALERPLVLFWVILVLTRVLTNVFFGF